MDVETLEALEEALISADVGVAAADRIVSAVRARRTHGESLRAWSRQEILSILQQRRQGRGPNSVTPHVVLIVGVNGTGKTTTVGKLARLIKDSGRTPLICAADTFRAAAVEQLQVWATRAGVDFIRAQGGSRSGRGRVRRDRRRARRAAATSFSWIPRDGCTRAST